MAEKSFLSRRQFLKVSAQATAGLGVLWHFISSSAIADDAVPQVINTTDAKVFLRPVLDPSQFPNQLSFKDSLPSVRDQTRMLLFFPKPLPLKDVAKLLTPTGLVLEDDAMGSEPSLPHYRVNHADRRFWVRSKNGKPIGREMLKLLDDATTGSLERIGPVYRSPQSTERSGLYCPLPHVLVAKPQPHIDGKNLVEFFSSFNLREIPAISTYLKGFRYLVLTDRRDPTVYDLYLRFRDHDAHTIQKVLFDIMPLVNPLASSHSPNDDYYVNATQWNMNRIAAGGVTGSSGWELSKGAGIIIAVIDNGCDTGHRDLRFSTKSATFEFPSDDSQAPCRNPGVCPIDTNAGGVVGLDLDPHGTHVSGIAGGIHNNSRGVAGTAGESLVMSLRSANRLISERATAIAYAALNGAKVINISWAEEPNDYLSGKYKDWKEFIIDPIIKDAIEAGAVVCAATGTVLSATTIGYPASFDEFVIACGASTGDTGSPPNIDERSASSPYGTGLSVVAPGENLVSTTISGSGNGIDGDYQLDLSGTSFATPHVAGLAAMLMSRFPLITPRAVRRVIERTADKVKKMKYPYRYQTETFPGGQLRYPGGPWNEEVGYGRINCHHALTFSDVYIKDYLSDSGDEPSSPPSGQNFWSTSGIVIRPTDDEIFQPDIPLESSMVKLGQDNVVYVKVINRGPAPASSFTVEARLVRYDMTEFTQDDWNRPIDPTDSEHIQLTPLNTALDATFSNVAVGDSRLAKFRLLEMQVGMFNSNMWHPCILAHVACSTDYTNLNHKEFAIDSPQVLWLNNFAQRNVTFVQVRAGMEMKFPFMIGNPAAASGQKGKAIEIIIERKLFPVVPFTPPGLPPLPFPQTPARLSLDVDLSLFPTVKSLAPLEATTNRQRDSGTQIRPRSFEFDGQRATFSIVPLETRRAALLLETEIPKTAHPGQFFQSDISQHNRQGQVVGGVTVIYHIVE